ncbi:MAG: SLBB domain-containing protein [Coriobacteriia bacterium]|nr:SLBB domain-containing protein [Coriobacteriia bacterium]
MSAKRTILVCCDTGCIASGSKAVVTALKEQLALAAAAGVAGAAATDATVEPLVKQTGCHGFCGYGPVVKVMPDDISYYRVKPKDAAAIIESLGGEPVERLLYRDDAGQRVTGREENPFYSSQKKLALRNVGELDPELLDDALSRGVYESLKKALTMTPEEIISQVERSGIRGRGGAGFPAGRKWRIAAGYNNNPKYVILNGDEGDPGAFMDRSMLEGDPHSVLEGVAICAVAVGATDAYLYIRDEYTTALRTMKQAILDAEAAGILGDSVLGSDKQLRVQVVRGGGAFVCGESSAMIASIEGAVGEPRAKYIRSTQEGLWGQPTVLNNVETFINIPLIIANGGDWYAQTGTDKSKGTKVFALVGKIKRSGLIEVPMGTTLREIIFDIGGGIPGNRRFKAIQTGGPSGGCLPDSLLDVPVDFDTLLEYGSMMGSGGMIVMDERTCMVETARYYVEFLARECCGKCVPCREGLRWLLDILTRICEGEGEFADLEILEGICETMTLASRCALGKTAANPVITTLRYFHDEYEEHITHKRCPAGVCRMGVAP